MSYIFSRALVAAFLPDSCSDADVFVPSSLNPTPKPSLSRGRTTARSHLSRFGMTCAPLTVDRGAALLTSWLAGFPVRTSAPQVVVQGSTESAPDSGRKWAGSFAKYSPPESKWRTHQCSLLEGWDEFSETWPRWGSMRNGECFLRQTWTPPTFESESGSRRIWPTPCASAYKGSSPAALTRKTGRSRANDRIDHAVMASDAGQLNPQWVEWLMGWPIGHTALEPLATGRYREWLQQHGNC